ncbi:unnamed protein product [marine sediment metagenome]|uniref:Uncharacterized protein n=1 Tax=marine sediment metagenome TaxID=412755 RepID=X1G369_9ZZZZ
MLEIEKAIEKLSDCCDRGITTLDEDFKDAVRMGKKGLVLLSTSPGHRLDDSTLKFLLNAERRPNE